MRVDSTRRIALMGESAFYCDGNMKRKHFKEEGCFAIVESTRSAKRSLVSHD
jgi:hypothetical protein